MDNNEYKVIDIEGGDQVGKGDAVRNVAEKLSQDGIETTVVSFPYYATPIGQIIREVLNHGFKEDLGVDIEEEIKIKMSLFALNRLEILNCILYTNKKGVFVFDRGPFSNALTIAYGIISESKRLDAEGLVIAALDLDRYMIDTLGLDRCVIKLETKDIEWVKSRVDGDLHEISEVQEKSQEIYLLNEALIGQGWINIITRDENGWRERADIMEEIIQFANTRLGIYHNQGEKSKNPYYLSILDIQEALYFGSIVDIDDIDKWNKNLIENNKNEQYKNAEEIAHSIASSVRDIRWYNNEIRSQVERIIREYPTLLYIIQRTYGEEFLLKFINSLDE